MPDCRKSPNAVEIEAGTHYLCACGKSKNGAFCDGSHQGTGCSPRVHESKEKQTIYTCACGKTKNAPFCDGAHASL